MTNKFETIVCWYDSLLGLSPQGLVGFKLQSLDTPHLSKVEFLQYLIENKRN